LKGRKRNILASLAPLPDDYEKVSTLHSYIFNVLDNECSSDKYLCDNGECISQRFVCDGDNTCADGSDETHCQCLNDQFKCETSGECVYIRNICDGLKHCKDASDEQNCCKF
jgi:low density lipoprotein-related protein 2